MSARFGRNKRRAAREAVAEAQSALAIANAGLARLRSQVADAERRGMERLLNEPERIDHAVRVISQELGRSLPAEMLPYAEKLMKADMRGRSRAPVRFDANIPYDTTFQTVDIQGSIDLRFAMRVAQW